MVVEQISGAEVVALLSPLGSSGANLSQNGRHLSASHMLIHVSRLPPSLLSAVGSPWVKLVLSVLAAIVLHRFCFHQDRFAPEWGPRFHSMFSWKLPPPEPPAGGDARRIPTSLLGGTDGGRFFLNRSSSLLCNTQSLVICCRIQGSLADLSNSIQADLSNTCQDVNVFDIPTHLTEQLFYDLRFIS